MLCAATIPTDPVITSSNDPTLQGGMSKPLLSSFSLSLGKHAEVEASRGEMHERVAHNKRDVRLG